MEKEEFSKFMSDVYCHSLFSLSLLVGRNLGLFDVFCDTDKPLSVQDIADKANLKERYTKEWLSSMVAAKVIRQDRETELYILPESVKPDLKALLSVAPAIKAYYNSTDIVQNCFRKDGPQGFDYDEDPDWYEWYHDCRSITTDHSFDSDIIPLLTENGIIPKLESGIAVLDIGSGSGNFILEIAKRYSHSHFTGLEYSEKALEMARGNVAKETLSNVRFIKGDVHDLPDAWFGQFDWVCINDTLHDLHNPFKALDEIYTVMKGDGMFSVFDFGYNSNPDDNVGDMQAAMGYSISIGGCLPSSMKESPHVGYGTCWGKEEIEKAITGAKFKIQVQSICPGVVFPTCFFHCTK